MNNTRLRQPAIRLCLLLSFVMLLATSVAAQSSAPQPTPTKVCPLNEKPVPEGLTIRSVKVVGRRGVGPIEKRLRDEFVGKTYTRDLHYKAMNLVELALTDEANQSFEKQLGIIGGARLTKKGVGFILTIPCVEIDDASKSVDVIIKVTFLRLDLDNPANNLLTLPRSLAPSFYNKMPAFLRAFNPQMDFAYDRRTGPVAGLEVSTNLAELPALWRGEETSDSSVRADFGFTGQKSLNKRFYQTKTDLTLSKVRPSQTVEKLDFTAGFRADDQPLGEMRYVNNGLRLKGEIKLRPRLGLINSIYLSADYSGSTNKVYNGAALTISERDNRGSLRALLDGKALGGYVRAGLWFDATEVRQTGNGYRRLAGLLGYQTEIGSSTQTVGLEIVGGVGRSWGRVPLYALFYGGNNAGSFLYEAPDSPVMTNIPVGPLLRSYGKTQAGALNAAGNTLGGRSYWHVNLNLTIPVRRWSRRLIPDEVVIFTDQVTGEKREAKLNELLEGFAIGSAIGGIGDDILEKIIEDLKKKDPDLDEDAAAEEWAKEAEDQAKVIVEREIAPMVRFISRRANLFAIKPLIMLDAARIGGIDGVNRRLRFAAGGGLQFVVVVARAELGYMRSLPTIAGEPKGNFVFRLTFQNLF